MNWLIKENPAKMSIDDFLKKDKVAWTKVTNYQARNNLRAMQKGELVFYYHTGTEKAIVGLAKVASEAYPNPKDETWSFVDFSPIEKFKQPIELQAIKSDLFFQDFQLIKQGRLSVVPVSDEYFSRLMEMT